jgi:hypothetical protein
LQNTTNDWRFEKAPHVEKAGVRAYVGVPLKFETELGEHVAFGSLCVVSSSRQDPLSKTLEQVLVRLADWIVTDIVHSARTRRQRERRRMLELLSEAQQQCDSQVNMDEEIPRLLQEVYPDTKISINQIIDNKIALDGGTSFRTSELDQGLWEDTACKWQYADISVTFNDLALTASTDFDYAIEKLNHSDMTAPRAVRAIAAQCTTQHATKFLVVASNDFKMVFDDVDSWFVHMCAVSNEI